MIALAIFLVALPYPDGAAAGAHSAWPSSPDLSASIIQDMHSIDDSAVGPARTGFDSEPMLGEAPIPDTTATALFAVDVTSGSLLYSYNADVRVAPASTLKIVTAITALTVLEPEELIEIGVPDLVDTTVYSNAQLMNGDLTTVEALLAGLLIPSGGDAANALARVAGARLGHDPGQSPRERFVQEMNRIAESIGMTSSNFVNPDGPDHPEQFTTARDMAIAAGAMMGHRILAEIVAMPAYEMRIIGPNARNYEIVNTNALLNAERVHGIKTGTTGQAGESIILATWRGGNRVITVVMGSENRYDDTLALLRYIDQRVQWIVFGASADFPSIQRAAERYNFVVAAPLTRPMLSGDANRLHSQLWLGPRPRGTLPLRWGHVVFLNDGVELYRMPVLSAGSD